jgi:hypothetical protein
MFVDGTRKEHKCKTCGHTKHEEVTPDHWVCDECKRPMGSLHLDATVFTKTQIGASRKIGACSWACMIAALRRVRSTYFVSLPYLYYDDDMPEGCLAKDFWLAIRPDAEKESDSGGGS